MPSWMTKHASAIDQLLPLIGVNLANHRACTEQTCWSTCPNYTWLDPIDYDRKGPIELTLKWLEWRANICTWNCRKATGQAEGGPRRMVSWSVSWANRKRTSWQWSSWWTCATCGWSRWCSTPWSCPTRTPRIWARTSEWWTRCECFACSRRRCGTRPTSCPARSCCSWSLSRWARLVPSPSRWATSRNRHQSNWKH